MKSRTGKAPMGVLLAAGLLVGVYTAHGDLSNVVECMPTQDTAQTHAALAALVQGGPEAVRSVCARLNAPGEGGDAGARYALGGLARYVTRDGAENERRMVASAFCEALGSVASAENAAFILRRLQECGGDESIKTLGSCLSADDLVEPATQALLSINKQAAAPLFLSALRQASKKGAPTLVRALGESRCRSAIPVLQSLLPSDDAAFSGAVLEALASIGTDEQGRASSCEALLAGCYDADPLRRSEARARCLRYAANIAADGATQDAGRMIQAVLKMAKTDQDAAMTAAALNTLADTAGDSAVDGLREAAFSDSRALSVAAIKRLQRMQSEKAMDALVSLLSTAPSHVRIACLENLDVTSGERVSGAVRQLLAASPDVEVQRAAIAASSRLLGRSAIPDFVRLMQAAETNLASVLKNAIQETAAAEDLPGIVAAFAGAGEAGQVALLDVLASRRAAGARDVVFGAAEHASPGVRKAALRAMSEIAGPEDMDRLVMLWLGAGGADKEVRAEAARALVRVGKGISDTGQRTAALTGGFDGRPVEERKLVLELLPVMGGGSALALVVQTTGHEDPALAESAVRALALWPDGDAAEAMLDVAERSQSLMHRVLLLRGFARVINGDKRKVDEQAELFGRAMNLAERPEEQNMLQSMVSQNKPLRARMERRHKSAPLALPAESDPGFVLLFNGHDLTGWIGNTNGYVVEEGKLVCRGGRHLFTEGQYGDFVLCFEFKLTPGANNGLGIRSPLQGDPAYAGMELQILDNTADRYKNLKPWQFHGSIYGLVPAKRGFLRPVGEWNEQEVTASGPKIKVVLNGETIVDADLSKLEQVPDIHDFAKHPGINNEIGHIGFLGHGDVVEFRNIRIRPL